MVFEPGCRLHLGRCVRANAAFTNRIESEFELVNFERFNLCISINIESDSGVLAMVMVQ